MAQIESIAAALDRTNDGALTADLTRCELRMAGHDPIPFELPQDRRQPLLEGVDTLDVILRSRDAIDAFETADTTARPWAYPALQTGAG